MISKELLSEVLNDEVGDYFYYKDNLLWFEQDDKEYNINIYEFAHKCKEWLEYNCFYDVMIVEDELHLMEDIWGEYGAYSHKSFTSESSLILNIFKACQYIMENKCGS